MTNFKEFLWSSWDIDLFFYWIYFVFMFLYKGSWLFSLCVLEQLGYLKKNKLRTSHFCFANSFQQIKSIIILITGLEKHNNTFSYVTNTHLKVLMGRIFCCTGFCKIQVNRKFAKFKILNHERSLLEMLSYCRLKQLRQLPGKIRATAPQLTSSIKMTMILYSNNFRQT